MPRYLIYVLTIILFAIALPTAIFASVIINEIAWMGTETSANDEWIELLNNTTTTIDIEGWLLKTADNKLKINLSGKIPSQGFFLLERTDDETLPGIPADIIYTGSLNNQGENLRLIDNQGNIIDEVSCVDAWPAGNNTTKQTMSRRQSQDVVRDPADWCNGPAGGTSASQNQCLDVGKPNIESIEPNNKNKSNVDVSTTTTKNTGVGGGTGVPPSPSGGVYINEIMPSPEGNDAENEWIELFNANNFEVDLTGWQIKDGLGAVKTYTFPTDTEISANGFLVLSRVQTKITLQNNGDFLELTNPSGAIVDRVEYGNAPQGQSYNKIQNGYAWINNPTPGKENNVLRTTNYQLPTTNEQQATIRSQPATINNQSFLADISKQPIENNQKNSKNILTFLGAIAIAGVSALIVWVLRKNNKENLDVF